MSRHLLTACLLATVILLLASSTEAQVQPPQQKTSPLFGHRSIDRAWKVAIKGRKPLLVMFTSDQCLYCKKMLKETYGHPAIVQLLATNTESVLAHAEHYPDLVKKLGIRGFPTTMIVSPEGKVLDMLPGFVEPKAFAQRVQPILKSASTPGRDSGIAVSNPRR